MTSNEIDTTPDGPAPEPTMTVLFEVTATGSVYTIDTDPPSDRVQDAPLPWKREMKVSKGISMLQVVAVGRTARVPAALSPLTASWSPNNRSAGLPAVSGRPLSRRHDP